MSKSILMGATGVVLAVLLAGCGVKYEVKSKQEQKPQPFDLKSAVGKPTPTFSLKDADGQAVRPADYKGKVVLLDFWATWCGPCKVEIPWFIDFEREFKDQGFAVVGVSLDEDGWTAIKPYAQNMKMNYRILLGNDEVSAAYGGLDALPTTLLIDRQGKIASVHEGVTMGKEDFKNAIVELLHAPREGASRVSRGCISGGYIYGGCWALLAGPNGR